jgi:hypothetical protein
MKPAMTQKNRTATCIALLLCTSSAISFASVITGSTNLIGTTYTVVVGKSNEAMEDLTASTIFITYSGGGTDSCTFTSLTGTCTGGGFSFTGTPPTSQTNSATWVLTSNQGAGIWITSATFDILPSSPSKSGFDVGSITTVSAGTTTATATATLNNALHTAVQTPAQATEYGQLILTFSTAAGARFVGGTSFDFGASTHFIDSAIADAPEPGTLGMVGLALAGIGALRLRKRRRDLS